MDDIEELQRAFREDLARLAPEGKTYDPGEPRRLARRLFRLMGWY